MSRTYTSSDNQIVAKKGEVFAIELEGNPTTGYEWQLELETGAIKSVDQEYQAAGQGLGAGGRERFRLKAIKPGDTVVRAIYKRPWEQEPIEEKKFKIHID